MFTSEKNHRNIVDLAKTTFIRPGSNKAEYGDTPPHSFDIVTTEREWTLCAESQENVQKWLKILNRCVDEDVAILPDEELIFKVKPKVDPLGVLPATDYSTALKVSASGVSVTTPDPTNNGAEREHFFWVYTDFYKWSLLSQVGKLALLVNVFADSSFSRRNEYIFRTKDAVRLATAIEYFIEKFMSVMHVRLETLEEPPETAAPSAASGNMHGASAEAEFGVSFMDEVVKEVDLLELDGGNSPKRGGPVQVADPFGGSDPFADGYPAQRPGPTTAAATVDLLGADDPFGGSDPFANDFGGVGSAPAKKVAPPLSASQLIQFKAYMLATMAAGTGTVYDDGSLKIAAKLDVRGSQARLLLLYSNQTVGSFQDLKVEVLDQTSFLRLEAATVQPVLAAGAQQQQQIMMEIIKPAFPGLQLDICYTDPSLGERSHRLDLPVLLTTFNEPLPLVSAEFLARWNQLVAPGLEAQEVLQPASRINPAVIKQALNLVGSLSGVSSVCKISVGLQVQCDRRIAGCV